MKIRYSNLNDITEVIDIFNESRVYLKQQGINQWQDNYPGKEDIKRDIELKQGYVVTVGDKVVAVFSLIRLNDPNYDEIYDGEWSTDTCYAIHRIATSKEYRKHNLTKAIIEFCINEARMNSIEALRIDTHRNNYTAQSAFTKNGFKSCGYVYLNNTHDDLNYRLAYELVV